MTTHRTWALKVALGMCGRPNCAFELSQDFNPMLSASGIGLVYFLA